MPSSTYSMGEPRAVRRFVYALATAIKTQCDEQTREKILAQAEYALPLAGQTFGVVDFEKEEALESEITVATALLTELKERSSPP